MGRVKQSRPIKRRRVILEADDSIVAEEQTTLLEQQQLQKNYKESGGEEELAKAIEFLRKTPPDQVEAAAAEATRLDLTRNDRWIHLRLPRTPLPPSPAATTTIATVFSETHSNQRVETSSQSENTSESTDKSTVGEIENATTINPENRPIFSSSVPSWSRGLGFARIASEDYLALQKLHQVIKDRINRKSRETNNLEWASWSGSMEDPRKRAFGFLAGTWGYDPQIRNNRLDITMPTKLGDVDTIKDERTRNKRAMLVLEKADIPEGVEKAIRNLCRHFRMCLLSNEKDSSVLNDVDRSDRHYRNHTAQFLRYEYLIAAQPNLHSGRALLPVHLDDPRKDGFGVIIVTIGMEGAGTIILRDAKQIHRGIAMRLDAGDAYILSDRARDSCAHGVLADCIANTRNNGNNDVNYSERESLNLRFGLHDLEAPSGEKFKSSPPVVPMSMVLRNWEE